MLDVCVPVQYDQNGEKKTKFVKVGIAFEGKSDGTKFVIKLDALPLGNTLVLTVPRQRNSYGSKGGYGNKNTQRNNDRPGNEPANDDDVPF